MTFFNMLTKKTYAFKTSTQIIYFLNTAAIYSQMSMTFFGDSHTAVLAFCFFRVSRLQVVLGYLNLNYYNLKPKRTFLLISPHNTRMLIWGLGFFFEFIRPRNNENCTTSKRVVKHYMHLRPTVFMTSLPSSIRL